MNLVINTLLFNNIEALSLTLICFLSLFFLLPPFYFFKFIRLLVAYAIPERVAGKVVVITGASSGIGVHLAYEYARRGAYLVLAARRRKSLHEVADTCLGLGSPDVIVIAADVSNIDDCKRIVDSTILHFGRMDHLVCNAGIVSIGMVEEYDDITLPRSVMDINFWGSVYITHFAIPHLRNTKGKILVMSSAQLWVHGPRTSFYNASKAAMVALYETLKLELGSDIRITIATPGFVESEMTRGKHLSIGEGTMKVDHSLRDILVSVVPVAKAEACAKSMVNSMCHGHMYVTYPSWYNVTYWFMVFCPEIVEWFMRQFYLSKDSSIEPLSKMMMDLPWLKVALYPSTMYLPEIKHE